MTGGTLKNNIGKILSKFTSLVKKVDIDADNSYFASKVKPVNEKIRKKIAEAKRKISRIFSESRTLKLLKRLRISLLRTSMRSYGIALLLFGLYSAAISVMRHYITDKSYLDASLLTGLICVVVAILFLTSSKTLVELLCESSTASKLIETVFCLRPDDILNMKRKIRSANIAVIIGSLCGLLTFFVEPQKIIYYGFMLLLGAILIFSPEFGINALVLLLPFLNESKISLLIFAFYAAYILKYIRGKRIFSFGASEMLPAIIGIIGVIRVLINLKGSPISLVFAVCIPLLYLAVQNMFRTRKLSFALADTLGISFFLVYGVRILCSLASYAGYDFTVASSIGDISAIGEYAVLCVGFALFLISRTEVFLRKLLLCTVVSFSVTVMLASGNYKLAICALIAALVYIIASRQKSMIIAFPYIAIIPIAYLLSAKLEPVKAFISIFTQSENAVSFLNASDFMYVFGFGGFAIMLIFFIISISKRLAVRCGNDGERRSLYAATYSFVCGMISYFLLCGIKLRFVSLVLVIIAVALSSALSGSYVKEKENG